VKANEEMSVQITALGKTQFGLRAMSKQSSQISSRWAVPFCLVTADVLALACSYVLAVCGLLWYGSYSLESNSFAVWFTETGKPQILVYTFFCFLVCFNFWYFSLYSKRRPFWDELLHVIRTIFYVALTNGVVVLVAKWPFSRFVWLVSWSLGVALIPVFRSGMKSLLRSAGWWQKPTVILGAGPNALDAYRALQSERGAGYEVMGFISLNGSIELPAPVQSVAADEVLPLLKSLRNPHLILALSQSEMQKHSEVVQRLILRYQSFSWIPDISGLPLMGMDVSHFFRHEVLLLDVKNNLDNYFARSLKRLLDIVLCGSALIVLAPLFAYIAFQIRKTKGPIFFGHERIGQGGKKFLCYKFRTMIPDADENLKSFLESNPEAREEWEREYKLKNDPRITPIGDFLRRSSLDELPQLWNAFIGEMSLVGPRPVTEEELVKYGDKVDFYLATRPGITGLWQVSGRNDVTYEARTNLDAWYVKNWNVWYDIVILCKTVRVVLGEQGAY
jgi:Undecaprenyl-phosphate galactose phosphotransferase WbaP